MAPDRFLFETGLTGHDALRLTRVLAEVPRVSFQDPATIVFEDVALGEAFREWVDSLVGANRTIHEIAKRAGSPIRPYKPRDMVNLYAAVLHGMTAGEAAAVVHEVIWRQPFSNANHRTATAAFEEHAGIVAEPEEIRAAAEASFIESKRLLDGSDKSLTDDEAKATHLAEMRRMCAALQSIK